MTRSIIWLQSHCVTRVEIIYLSVATNNSQETLTWMSQMETNCRMVEGRNLRIWNELHVFCGWTENQRNNSRTSNQYVSSSHGSHDDSIGEMAANEHKLQILKSCTTHKSRIQLTDYASAPFQHRAELSTFDEFFCFPVLTFSPTPTSLSALPIISSRHSSPDSLFAAISHPETQMPEQTLEQLKIKEEKLNVKGFEMHSLKFEYTSFSNPSWIVPSPVWGHTSTARCAGQPYT